MIMKIPNQNGVLNQMAIFAIIFAFAMSRKRFKFNLKVGLNACIAIPSAIVASLIVRDYLTIV